MDLRKLVEELGNGIVYVVALTYAEKLCAKVIACSDDRRLRKKLCALPTKRRINGALAILRKEGVVDEEQYRYLKSVFRAVRCWRNAVLHEVCRARCPRIEVDEVSKALDMLRNVVEHYVAKYSKRCVEPRQRT